MSKLVKVTAIPKAGFYRVGRFWPHEGVVVDAEELGEAVCARLAKETMLRIEPAPEGAQKPAATAVDDELRARLRAAIAGLPSDAFGASGAPNLAPLREALPDDAARITGDLRDEVWAELQGGGTG